MSSQPQSVHVYIQSHPTIAVMPSTTSTGNPHPQARQITHPYNTPPKEDVQAVHIHRTQLDH